MVAIASYYIFSTDLSQPVDKVQIEQKKVKAQKPKRDIPITYDVQKKQKKTPHKETPHKETQKKFQNYVSENIEQLHTLSTQKVKDYTISVKTVTKPKVNKFSPPTLPTMIVGEINGDKFSLGLDNSVKDQDIFLTITKNGATAVIDFNTIKNTPSGQMVDIGNINPPQDFANSDLTNFTEQTTSNIEQNVQKSENSSNSNFIAPPTPPTTGGL